MGTFQRVARGKARTANLPSESANATVNRAGGVAFEVKDPSLKLVTMTGVVSCKELDEVAREVIATALDVAGGKNPQDLLAIANWLRNEMNIRLTPQVLLVLASRMGATKSLVRLYAPHIVKRPDEVKTCLLTHRFFFGMKSLSNGLNMGLGDAVSRFGERGLMKYDSPDFPTWKDVLCWIRREKDWPLKSEVAKYFISGQVVDESKTPVIAARKALAKKTVFDAEAKRLAKTSMVNWEVLLSQFKDEKKALWEFLISEELLGYMSLLRNLRNILGARVDAKLIEQVSAKISSKDEVLKSKQLPFRFLSALRSLQDMDTQACDVSELNELSAAVELASNEACANIPRLPGVTAIFADNSGSMDSPVSEKSTVSCKDAANVLCGIVAKVAEKPYVVAFGTNAAAVKFTKNDTVLGIAEKARNTDIGEYSTNGHRCVEWLERNGLTPDRCIFLSDMQMWNDGSCGEANFANAWKKFKSRKGAKDAWLHSIHLNGYGDNVVDDGDRVNQVAGFSEKVFTMLLQTEGTVTAQALPTVEQIRGKWTVKA